MRVSRINGSITDSLGGFCSLFMLKLLVWFVQVLFVDFPQIKRLCQTLKGAHCSVCKWTIRWRSLHQTEETNLQMMYFPLLWGSLSCLFWFFYVNKVLQSLVFASCFAAQWLVVRLVFTTCRDHGRCPGLNCTRKFSFIHSASYI